MAFTGQAVFDAAVQRSSLNSAALVDPAQVQRWLNTIQNGVFELASQANPDYYGTNEATATRAAYTDSWAIQTTPGRVAGLTRAYVRTIAGTVSGVAIGDQINLIAFRHPEADVSPRAYMRGRTIVGYGTELGASTPNMVTSLTLYYTPLPVALTDLDDNCTVEDNWFVLLELPLAKILALRDRRLDEIAGIDAEYDYWRGLYIEHIRAFDHGARKPQIATAANPPQAPQPRGQ